MLDRLIDIYRELKPSFVLTHSLEDPYNVDHPEATRFAQEARIIAQAAGHKPNPDLAYNAPPVFLFEPHQPEQCNLQAQRHPQHRRRLGDEAQGLRDPRRPEASLGILHPRRLNRGMQGGRNSGRAMTYGEAYQRIFPQIVEELA